MGEDQALERLQAILARPEYRVEDSAPWWQQLLQPIIDLIWQLLAQLWQLLTATVTGREGGLGLVAAVASLAVLAAAAAYLVRAVRLSVLRDSAVRTATLAARRQRSDQLWQTAQQLAAAGQLSEAIRALYLSALYALDEHALLAIEPNLTNREHAERLARGHPVLADSFVDLVDRYERVRYGSASVVPATFAELSARAQSVRTAALEPAAA